MQKINYEGIRYTKENEKEISDRTIASSCTVPDHCALRVFVVQILGGLAAWRETLPGGVRLQFDHPGADQAA
jgi:hypothetical protein